MQTDIEKALNDGVAPWKEIEFRTEKFWIFSDSTAPAKGYLCFVPTSKTMDCLFSAYTAAYKWGYDGIVADKWQGFNIVQSVGEVAGQNIAYPHIHMIPRRPEDIE